MQIIHSSVQTNIYWSSIISKVWCDILTKINIRGFLTIFHIFGKDKPNLIRTIQWGKHYEMYSKNTEEGMANFVYEDEESFTFALD